MSVTYVLFIFFFFSSRRRHTRWPRDWSSDVCSSDLEEVAKAIAKRDKIRTVPSGNYALNILGLSTQVPMNIVLLTDGSPRELSVGNRKIKFKRTTPKNLLARGEVSRLVIQALKTIGEGKVTPEEEEKIISLLKRDDQEDLHHDILLAPVWIQKIMRKALVNVQD